MIFPVSGTVPATSLCVLPADLLSSVYSSEPAFGCSVSASFSLLSVALRTRARVLDKAGGGWAALGWTSYSVLLGAGAARLLWTCGTRRGEFIIWGRLKQGWMMGIKNTEWPYCRLWLRLIYLFQCIAQTKFRAKGFGFSNETWSRGSRRHKTRLFHCITQELAGSCWSPHFSIGNPQ